MAVHLIQNSEGHPIENNGSGGDYTNSNLGDSHTRNNIGSISPKTSSANKAIPPTYSFMLRSDLPSYTNVQVTSDEPPKYEVVTGEHLNDELDHAIQSSLQSSTTTHTLASGTRKNIKCMFIWMSIAFAIFVFIVWYWFFR